MKSLAFVGLAVVSAFLATPRQVEVKSVAIAVLPKAATTATFHLKNARDSALVAWEVGLLASGDAMDRIVTTAGEDHFWMPVATGSRGPMQPGESREMRILRGGPASPAAVVTMAIFADGYSEGTATSLQKALKSWQERADDLAWWARAFNDMPRSSDAEARRYLAAKIVERSPLPDSVGIRANLGGLVRADPPPRGLIVDVERRFRQGADAQLAMARRFLARGIPAGSGAVKSVRVDFTAAPSDQYDLRIENLTDKVIEAWGLEVTAEKHTRQEFADACADAPDSTSPRGRFQPHQVRLEPLSSNTTADQPPPLARVLYVVFDDLSAEGPQDAIERVFRERERQAEEYAYWIPVLKDTETMPASEVKAFLEAKEAERARHAAAAGRFFFPETRDLRELLDRSPDRFAVVVDAKIQSMEEARTRLLRHVKAE